jgi:hypothetical protein
MMGCQMRVITISFLLLICCHIVHGIGFLTNTSQLAYANYGVECLDGSNPCSQGWTALPIDLPTLGCENISSLQELLVGTTPVLIVGCLNGQLQFFSWTSTGAATMCADISVPTPFVLTTMTVPGSTTTPWPSYSSVLLVYNDTTLFDFRTGNLNASGLNIIASNCSNSPIPLALLAVPAPSAVEAFIKDSHAL